MAEYRDTIFKKEGHVATLTLNRPSVRNAYSERMGEEMTMAVDDVRSDDSIRVMVVTGSDAGKAFCAGLDVNMVNNPEKLAPKSFAAKDSAYLKWKYAHWYHDQYLQFRNLDKPVICALNGVAVGMGADLPLICDIIIAADDARIGWVYVQRGIIADMGGLWLLPRIVGWQRASELIFAGDIINAQEAYRLGIVNRVVPHADLMKVTYELSNKIAGNPPVTVQLDKQVMRLGLDQNLEENTKTTTQAATSITDQTEDMKEGFRAFAEKRPPVYKGR